MATPATETDADRATDQTPATEVIKSKPNIDAKSYAVNNAEEEISSQNPAVSAAERPFWDCPKRNDWLKRIAADSELCRAALRSAIAIQSCIDSKNDDAMRHGLARRVQSDVARMAGLAVRTLQKGLKQLEERGHLIALGDSWSRKRDGAAGLPVTYQLLMTGGDRPSTREKSQRWRQFKVIPGGKGGRAVLHPQPATHGGVPPTPPLGVPPTPPLGVQSLLVHLEDSLRDIGEAAPSFDFEAWFSSEFWPLYPRKVAKADARQSAKAALKAKKATPAQIIEGLRRYVASVAMKDPQYTAHPASWINGERWADEYSEPRGLPARVTNRGRARTEEIGAEARAMIAAARARNGGEQ